MSKSSQELKALIYYNIRRGWYSQASQICESIPNKGRDPFSLYWQAITQVFLGEYNTSRDIIESLKSRRDLRYPALLALQFLYKRSGRNDQEVMQSIRSELSMAEHECKEVGLLLAARLNLFNENFLEAKRLVEKILVTDNTNASSVYFTEALIIDGWCQLEEVSLSWTDSSDDKIALRELEESLGAISDPDCMLLRSKIFFKLNREEDFYNVLNILISNFPTFTPALADKALVLINSNKYDQALDICQRILEIQDNHIDALQIIAVHSFINEGQIEESVRKLEDLVTAVRKLEPKSVSTFLLISSLFSKISGRIPQALRLCAKLANHSISVAVSLNDEQGESKSLTTLGNICLKLTGSIDKGIKAFREAIKKDPNSIPAQLGLISCHILEGQMDDAESQLELLGLMHSYEEIGYEALYLQAILLKNKLLHSGEGSGEPTSEEMNVEEENTLKKNKQIIFELFYKCRSYFLNNNNDSSESDSTFNNNSLYGLSMNTYLNSYQNLLTTNDPDFLIELGLQFLSLSEIKSGISFLPPPPSTASLSTMNNNSNLGGMGMNNGPTQNADLQAIFNDLSTHNDELPPPITTGLSLLSTVLQTCPGMISIYLEFGRIYSSLGMYDEAIRVLHQGLTYHPKSAAIFVSLSFVEVARKNPEQAQRFLDQALSSEFSIRSVIRFKLAKAVVLSQLGKFSESIEEMKQVIETPEFTEGQISSVNNNSYWNILRLSEDDRVLAYICYADSLSQIGQEREAQKILGQGRVLFAGTSNLPPLLFASARIFIRNNNYDSALRCIDLIPPSSSAYFNAQTIKGKVYLYGLHDRDNFLRTFKSLVTINKSSQSYVLLGEAYLTILNPEEAILSFEEALAREKDKKKNPTLISKIGRAFIATHDYINTIDFYNKVLKDYRESEPTEIYVNFSHDLAKLYLKLGRFEKAKSVLQVCLHETQTDYNLIRQNVLTLILLAKANIYDSQVEYIKDAYESQMLYHNLIRTLPINIYSILVEQSKRSASKLATIYAALLIRSYEETKDNNELKKAQELLEEALSLFPLNSEASFLLALVYRYRNDWTKSLNRLKSVIKSILLRLPCVWDLGGGSLSTLAISHEDTKDFNETEKSKGRTVKIVSQNSDSNNSGLTSIALPGLSAGLTMMNTAGAGTQGIQTYTYTSNTIVGTRINNNTMGGVASSSSSSNEYDASKNEDDVEDEISLISGNFIGQDGWYPSNLAEPSFPISSSIRIIRECILLAADVYLLKQDMDGVLAFLLNYVSRVPFDYPIIDKIIQVMRRAGKLREGEDLINALEKLDRRCTSHSGYHYCVGLYSRYTHNLTKALQSFYQAKCDPVWAASSLTHMIELYLNPDQEGSWEESDSPVEIPRDNITAAQKLLQELSIVTKDKVRLRILEAYCNLATRNKNNIEKAMEILAGLLTEDPDCLSATLALATAYMIEKNHHKARNVLKRVGRLEQPTNNSETKNDDNLTVNSSLEYTLLSTSASSSDYDDYEKSTLLLAKMYLEKSKIENAQDCIRRCLANNQSSSSSWALLGQLFEKQSEYFLASEAYEKAFQLEYESSATIGYKLAFCYLKCKKYVEAIEIGEIVLKQYPTYPRLREDIIQKAISLLRTTN